MDHRIDSRAADRYLSYKMTVSDNKSFKFSGFDIDVTQTGSRCSSAKVTDCIYGTILNTVFFCSEPDTRYVRMNQSLEKVLA